MQKEEKIYKVVTLGEGRVGKTSIITRFVNNNFRDTTEETIEGYCLEKSVQLKHTKINLSIWDTAGQEKYNSMAPLYYRDADAALLVFDVTIKETLKKVQKWIKELKQFSQNENILFVMVGNKCDKINQIDVDDETIKSLSEEVQAKYFSASAKSSKGIDDIFQYIALQLNEVKEKQKNNRGLKAKKNRNKLQQTNQSNSCNC